MKMLQFPLLRQTYEYDCGAKSVHATLIYYGIDASQEDVMKITGTNPNGTPVKGIIKAIKSFGLKAEFGDMTIDDIKKYIKNKIPVIVLVQAWSPKKVKNWRDHWTDGHYLVAIGYDYKRIYFEDPYYIYRDYLLFDEFLDRWHDIDSSTGKKHYNLGIAVIGDRNKLYNPKKIIHLDK